MAVSVTGLVSFYKLTQELLSTLFVPQVQVGSLAGLHGIRFQPLLQEVLGGNILSPYQPCIRRLSLDNSMQPGRNRVTGWFIEACH
jgi:hypothetical protein